MQSKETTVREYLSSLPADRRAAIEQVRDVILKNLDKDFEEGMAYGMIGYYVPHRVFPDGYHCDPKQGLPFAALASAPVQTLRSTTTTSCPASARRHAVVRPMTPAPSTQIFISSFPF